MQRQPPNNAAPNLTFSSTLGSLWLTFDFSSLFEVPLGGRFSYWRAYNCRCKWVSCRNGSVSESLFFKKQLQKCTYPKETKKHKTRERHVRTSNSMYMTTTSTRASKHPQKKNFFFQKISKKNPTITFTRKMGFLERWEWEIWLEIFGTFWNFFRTFCGISNILVVLLPRCWEKTARPRRDRFFFLILS